MQHRQARNLQTADRKAISFAFKPKLVGEIGAGGGQKMSSFSLWGRCYTVGMQTEAAPSEGERQGPMNRKQEAPTALTYVKLRNWREIDVDSPRRSGRQETTTLYYDEPCLVHVDYQTMVTTILRHIDNETRVHALDMSTGGESVSEPIQPCDLTRAKPDERNRVSRDLAHSLYEAARQIVHYRAYLRTPDVQHPKEFDVALAFEGHLAGLLAPYHNDPALLASAAAMAAGAQTEGRLTAWESYADDSDATFVQPMINS